MIKNVLEQLSLDESQKKKKKYHENKYSMNIYRYTDIHGNL